MHLIDTHAHSDDTRLPSTTPEFLAEMERQNITAVFVPNTDEQSVAPIKALCDAQPALYKPLIGLHPTYLTDNPDAQLDVLEETLLANPGYYVGIGEIGLDLYWRKDNLPAQQAIVRRQLGWAKTYQLPAILHSRDAFTETLAEVTAMGGGVTGIFHCFSGSAEDAQKVIELGFKIGIGGNVTYKKNATIETLRQIGLEHVVLETDSPYLAPEPHRSKQNTPLHIATIAAYLAQELGMAIEEVAAITTANALSVYGAHTVR